MTDLSELEALVGRATPGPYDHRSGLVRAIRGDMAVPLFEVRGVYDPTIIPPTVRYPDGKVLFKAGSHDARHSYAEHQRGRNGDALAAILNTLSDLLSTIRSQEAALVELRGENEELKHEAELFDADHADQNCMVDRIANLIGLPHDSELDTTAFELWFSEQARDRDALRAALAEAREALEPFAKIKIGAIDVGQTITMLEDDDTVRAPMKVRDIRRAASVLSKLEGGE